MSRKGTCPSGFLVAFAAGLLFDPAPLAGFESPLERISCVADLGLSPGDIPVSRETKIAYLVNPAFNRPGDLEALLRSSGRCDPAPEGWSPSSFNEDEIRALTAAHRPGDTAAYDAVSDSVEEFFKYMFEQVPCTERSLHRIVQEVNRTDFPLASVDASPRVLANASGKVRLVETILTVRLFMVHVEYDRERNLRWVTRCELCFEDSSTGRAPLRPGASPAAALGASVVDAFRGKIAVSFTHAPELRRPSGKIDEPRRDLIDRSISSVPESSQSPRDEGARSSAEEKGPEENR